MRLIIAILCCLLTSQAFADKYLRQGATGSANGSDWTNAYTTLSAAVAGAARGEIIWVADSVAGYAGGNITKAVSGTTLLTVKKATIASHGTSTGWSDAFGDGQAVFTSQISLGSAYTVLDGSVGADDGSVTPYGFKISFGTGANGGDVGDNSTIQYVEYVGYTGFGDFFYPASTVCIYMNGTNPKVSHCYLHGGDTLLNVGVEGHTNDGWTCNGAIIEYTWFQASRSTNGALHSNVAFVAGAQNGIWRYNTAYNYNDEGLFFSWYEGQGGTGVPKSGIPRNWQVYGNVFTSASGTNPRGIEMRQFGPGQTTAGGFRYDNYLVYNNTFVSLGSGGFLNRATDPSDGGAGSSVGCAFVNNLGYNAPNTLGDTATVSNNTQDATNRFVNLAGRNYHLAAPLAGISLAAQYNQDMDGNTRGADGVWDRGAYEFGAGGDPLPSLTSSVINAAGTQIALTFSEAVTAGAGGTGGFSLNMNGGAVTMSSPTGSGTSRTYSLTGRVIGSGESGTISYVQPGNGYEDSALQDVPTFSGNLVTNNSTVQTTNPVTFSPVAGSYFGTASVTLTSSTPGNTIRYTTDGSTPTGSSTQYVSPVPVSVSTTINAFAAASGLLNSPPTSASYEVGTWTSSAFWKNFAVPQQTGVFTWIFRASASSAAADGLIGLSPITSTSFNDLAVILRFNQTGTIDARNAGAYAAVNSFTYVPGTTYEFVVTVNVLNKTYSATVSQIAGTPVAIATNYAFRTEQASAADLDNVGISAPGTGTVTVSQMSFGGIATIPTLTSATIGANGVTLALGFSVPVTYGSGGSGGWTISAFGGAATLTPTASPTSFTISRPISIGETGTISYVQPGNGVESASGGDLVTLSGFAFNNQSTVDLRPPTPSPMSFSSQPTAVSSFSVTMTASVAVDANTPPVQYYFDETSANPGGADSGWTTSRTYTNNGLSPGIQYTYRVLARDSSPALNQTTPSSSVNVTTPIIAGGKVITPAGTTGAGFLINP